MGYHDDHYVKAQDLYLVMRNQMKSGEPPTMEQFKVYVKQMKAIDKIERVSEKNKKKIRANC